MGCLVSDLFAAALRMAIAGCKASESPCPVQVGSGRAAADGQQGSGLSPQAEAGHGLRIRRRTQPAGVAYAAHEQPTAHATKLTSGTQFSQFTLCDCKALRDTAHNLQSKRWPNFVVNGMQFAPSKGKVTRRCISPARYHQHDARVKGRAGWPRLSFNPKLGEVPSAIELCMCAQQI
jgi:hypothetical protein